MINDENNSFRDRLGTVDEEAKRIVAQEYERAKQILIENAAGHNALAELLIEREVIFSEDFEKQELLYFFNELI